MNPFQILSFPYEIIHRFQMIVTQSLAPPPVWLIIILSPQRPVMFFVQTFQQKGTHEPHKSTEFSHLEIDETSWSVSEEPVTHM